MTSHYVMMTNKLYPDDRNNDYIVLCKLGSHTISGCRVTGVGPPEPPPPGSWEAKKKPGLNRVNVHGSYSVPSCLRTDMKNLDLGRSISFAGMFSIALGAFSDSQNFFQALKSLKVLYEQEEANYFL